MKIFEAAGNPPAELRAAEQAIIDALDKRANAERAAIANVSAISAAEVRIAELEASLIELDAQAVKAHAMAMTDSSLKSDGTKAAKAADKAASELANERRANERRVAVAALLDAEARGIDEVLPDLAKRLEAAKAVYSKQMLAAAHEELVAACKPLVPIIQSIAAIKALFPGAPVNRDWRDWLDCARLISPVGFRADHSSMSGHVRVQGTDLLATDEPLPELPIGAAAAIQELTTVSKALAQHRKYQPPKAEKVQPEAAPRSASEQRRYIEEAERIRRSEEEYDQREARGKEPAKWHSDVRYPGTPVPAARGRPGELRARSHDGSVSEEYARINEWIDDTQTGSSTRGESIDHGNS